MWRWIFLIFRIIFPCKTYQRLWEFQGNLLNMKHAEKRIFNNRNSLGKGVNLSEKQSNSTFAKFAINDPNENVNYKKAYDTFSEEICGKSRFCQDSFELLRNSSSDFPRQQSNLFCWKLLWHSIFFVYSHTQSFLTINLMLYDKFKLCNIPCWLFCYFYVIFRQQPVSVNRCFIFEKNQLVKTPKKLMSKTISFSIQLDDTTLRSQEYSQQLQNIVSKVKQKSKEIAYETKNHVTETTNDSTMTTQTWKGTIKQKLRFQHSKLRHNQC